MRRHRQGMHRKVKVYCQHFVGLFWQVLFEAICTILPTAQSVPHASVSDGGIGTEWHSLSLLQGLATQHWSCWHLQATAFLQFAVLAWRQKRCWLCVWNTVACRRIQFQCRLWLLPFPFTSTHIHMGLPLEQWVHLLLSILTFTHTHAWVRRVSTNVASTSVYFPGNCESILYILFLYCVRLAVLDGGSIFCIVIDTAITILFANIFLISPCQSMSSW